MNHLDIDRTIEYVKNIVDNISCPLCDKSDGQQMRYSCGHTTCNDCVIDANYCMICLTPPHASSTQPIPDDAFTQRVKNASVLLKACQDLCNTDVFQRKRLSEQQKIEKELFPKCIQAPIKYENKRKSALLFGKNKENRHSYIFPGEETSHLKENISMENSVSYVQQWLNKNDKDFSRKPFKDLNVNTNLDNNLIPLKNRILSNKDENVPVLKTNRTRSHFKTTVKNFLPLDRSKQKVKHNCEKKKVKEETYQAYKGDVLNETKKDFNNDESGIFMDNDPVIIDDSQDRVNDKDTNAWLAVLEANKNEEVESTSLDLSDAKSLNYENKQTPTNSDQVQIKLEKDKDTKVPFYKKSYLIETCTLCNDVMNEVADPSKQVKIIIDNDDFTTTINILKNFRNSSKLNTTNSVSVQTNVCETMVKNHYCDIKYSEDNDFKNFTERNNGVGKTSQKSDAHSEDLFADEGIQNQNENNRNACKYLIIEESDSDIDMEESGPLPVKVDVHRSCDESEYGVLGEILNQQEHDTRKRRRPRGPTPTSTDSSEKENFNPNRLKKHIPKKKKYTKK